MAEASNSTADERGADEPEVALEIYALVTAGLADGFELGELLELAELDPRTWERAEDAWADRILEDLSYGATLSLKLDELQRDARKRWHRPIPPLDEELRAWLDFQRNLASEEDVMTYLEAIPLRATDIGGLASYWGKRLESEPELLEKAKAILAEPPQPVHVPPPAKPQLPKQASDDVAGTGFFSAIEDVAASLPFQKDVAIAAPVRIAPALRASLPKPPPEPGSEIDRTAAAEFAAPVIDSGLPFVQQQPTPVVIVQSQPTTPAPAPPTPPPAAPVPVTAPVTAAAPAPVPAAAPAPVPSPQAAPPTAPPPLEPTPPSSARPRSEVDETAFAFQALDVGDALPFEEAAAAAPPVATPSPTEPDLSGQTSLATPALDLPATPFEEPPPSGGSVDQTAFGVAAIEGPATPFGNAPEHAPEPAYRQQQARVAATPFDRRPTPGAAGTPVPQLTLQQYAAVVVEIELSPERATEVLAHYGLDPSTKHHLDQHMAAEIGQDPVKRAEWDRAYATYKSWRSKMKGPAQ